VVECGGLENRYGRFTSIEGSNPSPSASRAKNSVVAGKAGSNHTDGGCPYPSVPVGSLYRWGARGGRKTGVQSPVATRQVGAEANPAG
jgi:hypothetical protein